MAEERIAPLLAVGDHVKAGRFLKCDGFVNRAVFEAFELGWTEVAGLDALTRIEEVRRAQQTADSLASAREHRVILRRFPRRCQHRRPLTDQWPIYGDRQELIVDAIEDDSQRRERDEELLSRSPRPSSISRPTSIGADAVTESSPGEILVMVAAGFYFAAPFSSS